MMTGGFGAAGTALGLAFALIACATALPAEDTDYANPESDDANFHPHLQEVVEKRSTVPGFLTVSTTGDDREAPDGRTEILTAAAAELPESTVGRQELRRRDTEEGRVVLVAAERGNSAVKTRTRTRLSMGMALEALSSLVAAQRGRQAAASAHSNLMRVGRRR